MTGSSYDRWDENRRQSVTDIARRAIGHSHGWNVAGAGSFGLANGPVLNVDDDEVMDKLVARMMVHTQKVIVPCKFCGSHNAFSNPTCVQCGGPLG
jgi:hypothetical protein